MRFQKGQKVKIKRDGLSCHQNVLLKDLDIPYVATVNNIEEDFHCGLPVYTFKECGDWWYEGEVEGLYEEEVDSTVSRWEILDIC